MEMYAFRQYAIVGREQIVGTGSKDFGNEGPTVIEAASICICACVSGRACVEEFVEIANWFGWKSPYNPVVVDSLPDPKFIVKDRSQTSFSTNNYLGIATSPRVKAAAIRGIKTYGVGNSDSRLLGGNLGLYGDVERKLAKINGEGHAILFATGYLANIGALSTLPRVNGIARAFGYTASREYTYAYFNDEYGVTVLLAGGLPDDPTIFTMAHELKHHLVDSTAGTVLCRTDEQMRRVEIGAEVFAAELIYPEKDFVYDLFRLTRGMPQTLGPIGVPATAVLGQ